LRWNFVYQRPQHLLTRASREYNVIFFEEPIFEPDANSHLHVMQASGIRLAVPILQTGLSDTTLTKLQRDFVDELLGGNGASSVITWYYTPCALPFSRHLQPSLTVYDVMDELSAFLGAPPCLVSLERELLSRADVIFAGGQSLYEAKGRLHPNVHLFPSSIDAPHFMKARNPMPVPVDYKSISHPRLGFFGVIDERMDRELVAAVADLRPDWQLVMIGPVVKIDPAALPQRPNIHWLGPKSYDELPAHLAVWDLGIMPFALNEATRYISPTKTPEFLAAGLPVVSTPIRDVVRPYGELGLVRIAADARSFASACESLLEHPKQGWLSAVDRFLAGKSWDQTWYQMRDRMLAAARTKHSHESDAVLQPLGR
jgi:glycosyltransferase involved in cell wall biosynthesis